MTKTELVRVISKKAGVSDTAAKEFFDIFLRRIADKLQPGESAQFSNLGYFHFRKGKIKKQRSADEEERFEYLDMLIFSSSSQFKIKSPDNLVFSAPEAENEDQEILDSHFSLSIGKPVLPQLEGKESIFPQKYSAGELSRLLEKKVESLMINLNTDEIIKTKSEILLVDIKPMYEDQFELELDDDAKKKNSLKISDAAIHSSEKLKSEAWGFGKDLSRKIEKKSIPEVGVDKNEIEKEKESTSWDFGKRFWANKIESTVESSAKPHKNVQREFQKKKFDFSRKEKQKAFQLDEELIEREETEKPDIQMDDFTVTDRDEKIGKFERVRSITSSLSDEVSEKEIFGFNRFFKDKENPLEKVQPDNNFSKMISKAEKFHPVEVPKQVKETKEVSIVEENSETELKLNRSESKRTYAQQKRSSSTGVVSTIIVGIILICGILYLFLRDDGKTELSAEMNPPIERTDNTTYVERSYDIPVTYPYEKQESETKIEGLGSTVIADTEPKEQSKEKIKPKDEIEKVEPPIIDNVVDRSSDLPTLVAANIYKYNQSFVVQISSFRSKTVADEEATKYNLLGYNAFVESAVINGNTWYRVRVGDFQTLNEAKQFSSSK